MMKVCAKRRNPHFSLCPPFLIMSPISHYVPDFSLGDMGIIEGTRQEIGGGGRAEAV